MNRLMLIKTLGFWFGCFYVALAIDRAFTGQPVPAIICGIIGVVLAAGALSVKEGGDAR